MTQKITTFNYVIRVYLSGISQAAYCIVEDFSISFWDYQRFIIYS